MKKRMIKLMTIFCMAGILTVNPAIIGLAEEESAVGAEVQKAAEPGKEPAADADTAQTYKYKIEYNDRDQSSVGADKATSKIIDLSLPAYKGLDGYEFLGFFKGEDRTNLYTNGSKYEVQEEDYRKGLIFYGVWRKEITVTADGQTAI